MFLKNCWYVAAWDYELIDGKLLARTLLGEHVLLYRGDSGQVIAMNNRCPHRGALLSEGRREGDDPNISRSLLKSLIEGFMEDKAIIERQQKTFEEDPSFQPLAILADAPLAHFRRVLDKLIEAEQAESRASVAPAARAAVPVTT